MKFFIKTFGFIFLLWLGGGFWYGYRLSQYKIVSFKEKPEDFILLTGGKHRLKSISLLLQKGHVRKLLISGVNEKVGDDRIFEILKADSALAQCCIEIDRKAVNTETNAVEAARWVRKNDLYQIRLVTSLEHMPRALVEFRRTMPALRITAHPLGEWRPENITGYALLREYNKYLYSLIRSYL